MKRLVFIIALLSCIPVLHGAKAKPKEKTYYLEMVGMLQQDMNIDNMGLVYLDSALVTVVDKKSGITQRTYLDPSGKMQFKLALNRFYTVCVTKNGFIPKIITVDTRVPANKLNTYTLLFDIFLFEKIDDINTKVLKKPIADVNFNGHWNDFIYNYTYTDLVNAKLKKQYAAYYLAHRNKPGTVAFVNAAETEGQLAGKTESVPLAVESNVRFHVQIIATLSQRDTKGLFFKDCGTVTEVYEDGLYKYVVGNFSSITQVQELKAKLRQMGYDDAFIVPEMNGKRIPIGTAVSLVRNDL